MHQPESTPLDHLPFAAAAFVWPLEPAHTAYNELPRPGHAISVTVALIEPAAVEPEVSNWDIPYLTPGTAAATVVVDERRPAVAHVAAAAAVEVCLRVLFGHMFPESSDGKRYGSWFFRVGDSIRLLDRHYFQI